MKALVVEPVPVIRENLIENLEKESFEVDGTESAKVGKRSRPKQWLAVLYPTVIG